MSAHRKGWKQCVRCGGKRPLTEGLCFDCRTRTGKRPMRTLKRRMPRQHIPGILKHLAGLGIAAEAVEVSPGNFVIRKKGQFGVNEPHLEKLAEEAVARGHKFYWVDEQAHQTCERCGAGIMDTEPCKSAPATP